MDIYFIMIAVLLIFIINAHSSLSLSVTQAPDRIFENLGRLYFYGK